MISAALLSACTTSLGPTVKAAPVLSVATGAYPIAEAVTLIGGSKVSVDDVVPPGDDPLTYKAGPSQREEIDRAGLLIAVGGDFLPATDTSPTVQGKSLTMLTALGTSDPYFWLDPALMNKAVTVIAKAMDAADPQAAPLFNENSVSLSAEVSSLDSDFTRILSACPGKLLVGPDTAFSSMATEYGLQSQVVAPDPDRGQIDALVNAVHDSGPAAIYSEPWVTDAGVSAIATVAHVTLHSLDTIVDPPPGGWPSGATYFALMEQDLGTLSSALGCNNNEQ
ncbi:MAG: metal ABC transporter substrate-binding protein [Acidimicrobiales bacterium]